MERDAPPTETVSSADVASLRRALQAVPPAAVDELTRRREVRIAMARARRSRGRGEEGPS